MGCHFLRQGIFPTQGWNPHLLLWQANSLSLSHLGSVAGRVSDRLGTEAGPTWLPRPLHLPDREFGPNLPMTRGPAAEAGRGCGSHRGEEGGARHRRQVLPASLSCCPRASEPAACRFTFAGPCHTLVFKTVLSSEGASRAWKRWVLSHAWLAG